MKKLYHSQARGLHLLTLMKSYIFAVCLSVGICVQALTEGRKSFHNGFYLADKPRSSAQLVGHQFFLLFTLQPQNNEVSQVKVFYEINLQVRTVGINAAKMLYISVKNKRAAFSSTFVASLPMSRNNKPSRVAIAT